MRGEISSESFDKTIHSRRVETDMLRCDILGLHHYIFHHIADSKLLQLQSGLFSFQYVSSSFSWLRKFCLLALGDVIIGQISSFCDPSKNTADVCIVNRSVPPLWIILIPYCIWITFDKAPDTGGRPKEWARRSPMWKYFSRQSFICPSFVMGLPG